MPHIFVTLSDIVQYVVQVDLRKKSAFIYQCTVLDSSNWAKSVAGSQIELKLPTANLTSALVATLGSATSWDID